MQKITSKGKIMRLSAEAQELLMHAGKAAGYEMGQAEGRPEHEVHTWSKDYEEYFGFWNPLENNSSAFRLAVDLNITFITSDHLTIATINGQNVSVDHGHDKYAATRLAIVKAAALQFQNS